MADFAPPTGPPPPRVPEGWKAVWNDQYNEWFFVNVYTKKSQWDKPTEPAYPAGEGPPDHAPPGYAPAGAAGGIGAHPTGASEKAGFGSNNPYANVSEDEKFARKLQEEEEARARGHAPGTAASNDYYNQQPGQTQPGQYGGYPDQHQYGQSQTPAYDNQTQDKGKSKGGLLGKLLGKASGHSSSSSHGYPPQQQAYGQQGYGAPMGGQYYAQPGRPMMGGMGGMGGGMGGRRPGGGGLGTGGALALGAGGGLLGGALLGEAMGDAGDGGGDYGGGDGGGDFGGGDGGGDFGGGDMGGDMGGGDF